MLGILVVHKPQGLTSHDVVNQVRRKLGTRRVGHAGSLDPMATGALVLAVGPATRFLQYLPLEPKIYAGKMTFGVETNTQDAEGEVVATRNVPYDLEAQLLELLPGYVGEVHQIAPMFSAVKRDGKPLYAYARQGIEVERETRTIYVDEIQLLNVEGPTAEFRVVCSGGTYVRTLAHDLGQDLGCGAHLSALTRTDVGKFSLANAVQLDDVAHEHLIPLHEALPPLQLLQMDAAEEVRIRQGQTLKISDAMDMRFVGLLDQAGRVFAVGRAEKNRLRPECVIPAEALVEVG